MLDPGGRRRPGPVADLDSNHDRNSCTSTNRQGVSTTATLLLLSRERATAADILPALGLLSHTIRIAAAEAASLLDVEPDVVLVDGRIDLVGARNLCRTLAAAGNGLPVLLVLTEGGLAALSAEWAPDDFILATAGPAELEARLRLASRAEDVDDLIRAGGVEVDEAAYTARLDGRLLDLTYTEFELLKYLTANPGRVFSREQLLSEVWGYDYYGGTRTVDVHVRRLRAKLGEKESLIGTVRNVGYRFDPR
ncbi:transcriptional regulator [Enemella evansiae]|uniref:Transcriptional regulator n=1 Tax=Enemella evansiae TaxID=2016499 RepID=A0A255G7E2_9ACTN|nr:transcriptional regulator [Enemella evansiae]OYO00145.1 transcriptional regulator [Enemella evansiae]OYO04622.1 transcriptional regulator [Enemella evansiae]OYO11795.1 transcriptional regulator [Enemella evansiae]